MLCVTDPTQVRIEQVIVAEPGAVLLYKVSNLLKFYHHTIRYLNSHNISTHFTVRLNHKPLNSVTS